MAAPFDTVIRNGHLIAADGRCDADIALAGGRIAAIGTGLPAGGAEEVDATGLWIAPGGIDPHAHVEQLSGQGLWNADTWESATRSAALGGTTTVITFAAQAEGEPLRRTVDAYAERAARGALIDHAWHIAVRDPAAPGFHEDLAALIAEGHRTVKVFTTYLVKLEDRQILDVMATTRRAGGLTCIHAENDGLLSWAKASLLAAGRSRPEHHAISHPRLAELDAIERMGRFADYLGAPVMIFHVSTAEGAAAVRAARGRGTPMLAETCPQYLFMTAGALDRDGIEGAKWMCSPPQRAAADQEALWAALARGDLCLVSSDHAPYRFDETGKLAAGPAPGFDRIVNGMPGLETRMPLLFDAMVHGGRGGPEAFVRVTATAAAEAYGLSAKGRLLPGYDADLVLWDPERRHTYGADDLHDAVGYNPYAGQTVRGWPVHVYARGERIVTDGTLTAAPGRGRWLSRPAVPAPPPDPEAAATGALG